VFGSAEEIPERKKEKKSLVKGGKTGGSTNVALHIGRSGAKGTPMKCEVV